MRRLIRPDVFGDRVTAFFTGRDPGADLAEIAKLSGVQKDRIYVPLQKHTDHVHILDSDMATVIADAVVTRRSGVLIGVQAADCVPLLLYDPVRHVAGAVHAGWRGTAAGILANTIKVLTERFLSDPKDICLAIGPSIKSCCYEVAPDVAGAVEKASGKGDYIIQKGAKYHVDLPRANEAQAVSAGVMKENIRIAEDCTFCNPEIYCSYRYSKGTTRRQGGFIGMKRGD